MPTTSPQPPVALQDLLKDMFSPAEAYRLIRWSRDWGGIAKSLPDPYRVSPVTWFEELVGQLEKGGFFGESGAREPFFQALKEARPYRTGEIGALEQRLKQQALAAAPAPMMARPARPQRKVCIVRLQDGAQVVVENRTALPVLISNATPLLQEPLARIEGIAESARKKPTDIIAYDLLSEQLSRALFGGAAGAPFAAAEAETRFEGQFNVQFEYAQGSPIGRYPWELIRPASNLDGLPLAEEPHVVLSRRVPLQSRGRARSPTSVRRLLLVSAVAEAAEEVDLVEAEWKSCGAEVEVVRGATLDSVGDAMSRGPWSVVHLSAHGVAGELQMADGGLLSANHLGRMASAAGGAQAVYLSTCHGGASLGGPLEGPGHRLGSTAEQLLLRNVRHVVASGARFELSDARRAAQTWHRTWLAEDEDAWETTRATRLALLSQSNSHAYGYLVHFHGAED